MQATFSDMLVLNGSFSANKILFFSIEKKKKGDWFFAFNKCHFPLNLLNSLKKTAFT
jgi:hypothetical protein